MVEQEAHILNLTEQEAAHSLFDSLLLMTWVTELMVEEAQNEVCGSMSYTETHGLDK